MLDIMYEIPSMENVKECVINKEVITKKQNPVLFYEQEAERA